MKPKREKSLSLLQKNDVIESILEIVSKARLPVSVEYVATRAALTWASTRALMFQLAIDGRLQAIKTTKSWIFVKPGQAKFSNEGGESDAA